MLVGAAVRASLGPTPVPGLPRTFAASAPLLWCLACGGQVERVGNFSTPAVLASADEVLNLLTRSEWGELPRTGWLQFEIVNGSGQIDGTFEFRDPLSPFDVCTRRRIENCVISECVWIAEDYADGGSMAGDAELPTLERLRLVSNVNGSAEFDVYDPFVASSTAESAAFLEGGVVPPGGAWWGSIQGFEREATISVWELDVWGGSLDGLTLSGLTLPAPPAVSVPEGVTDAYAEVEVSIPAGKDYQLSWQPSPGAEFFRVYSERYDLDSVHCFFDAELGRGSIPGEVTASFGLLELSMANLQVREFGNNLPLGKQALVVLSAAVVVEQGSGKAVRLT